MKTIDDVVRDYPDGVNNQVRGFVECLSNGEVMAYEVNSPIDEGELGAFYTKICTVEEYEQHLAAKSNTWYDYDNQQQITTPPVGTECEWCPWADNIWIGVKMIADVGDNEFVLYFRGTKHIVGNPDMFRPLDYNKNTPKIVDMSWAVGSGIDCEFSDFNIGWLPSPLIEIHDSNIHSYEEISGDKYKHCQPRMNHKMVVSWEQYQLIPQDMFKLTTHSHKCTGSSDNIIVEFTGLKDGWKFSYE